jgi:UDP-glucose 4-epimerase
METKRIIILGDTGYIGGKLKNTLLKQHPDIEILGFSFPEVDLTKNKDVLQLQQHVIPGTILVMCSGIKKQYGDSLDKLELNLKMVINVCKNLLSNNLLRFVFVSSAEVYGEDLNDLSITEETAVKPTSFYGIAKLVSEKIIKKSLKGFPETSYMFLRPALVFGPAEEGSFYGPSGFMKAAMKNEKIILWGDGSELREFVYVDDLIFVFISLIFNECEGYVNVVNGTSRSFKEIVEAIKKEFKKLEVSSKERTREKTDQGFNNKLLLDLVPGFIPTPLDKSLKAIRDKEELK